MRRASNKPVPPTPEAIVGPHVIQRTAIYTVPQLRAALGLRASTVRREVREVRLRVSKRTGKYLLLGEWILDWVRGGEIRRNTSAINNDAQQELANGYHRSKIDGQ